MLEKSKDLKNSKIILVGPGGCGKDYLCNYLLKNTNLKKATSYTTRPIRDGEKSGEVYHFVSREEFERMIENDEFYEWEEFIGWYYGSTKKTFEDSDIFIKTVGGIKNILPEDRKRCTIIYLDIDKGVRRERLNKRNDADNTERRLLADDKDFENFIDFDIHITETFFKPEEILQKIS